MVSSLAQPAHYSDGPLIGHYLSGLFMHAEALSVWLWDVGSLRWSMKQFTRFYKEIQVVEKKVVEICWNDPESLPESWPWPLQRGMCHNLFLSIKEHTQSTRSHLVRWRQSPIIMLCCFYVMFKFIHDYAIPALIWFLLILKVDTVQDVGVYDMLMYVIYVSSLT